MPELLFYFESMADHSKQCKEIYSKLTDARVQYCLHAMCDVLERLADFNK